MSQLLKSNSEVLSQFGGTTYFGAQKFADLAASLQYGQTSIALQRMGKSFDEINQDTAGYLRVMAASGRIGKSTFDELKEGAIDYINEQARLTRLTGKTAEEQTSDLADFYKVSEFAGAQYLLDAAGDELSKKTHRINEIMAIRIKERLGPKFAAGFVKGISGRNLQDEDVQKFQTYAKRFSALKKSGETNENKLADALDQDIKESNLEWLWLGTHNVANKWIPDIAKGIQAEGRYYNESSEKSNKAAVAEIAAQQDGVDPAVNAHVKLNTSTRNLNQGMDLFYNKGIVPVTGLMNTLSGGLSKATGIVSTAAGRPEGIGATTPTPAAPSITAPVGSAEGLLRFTGASGSKDNFDQLKPDVKNAFLAMVGAYGKTVTINSARRSPEDQQRLYSAWEKAGGSESNPIVNVPGMGRIRMPAKPGTSPHENGRAIDLDDSSFSALSGLFGKYGFKTVAGDPGHIQMASGGIATGPKDGYNATLHGTEAVIPMDGKKAISVISQEDTMADQQSELLTMKITKLDLLIKGMQTHYNTSHKILMRQS